MKKNIGTVDKIVRIILAIVIGALFYFETITGTLAYVLVALAGVFVLTSLINICPLYMIFGVKTCSYKEE